MPPPWRERCLRPSAAQLQSQRPLQLGASPARALELRDMQGFFRRESLSHPAPISYPPDWSEENPNRGKSLLGHASISTTGDIYADWDIDQLAETMRLVLGARAESFPPPYRKSPANSDLVEAAGIEPASAVAPNRASTSVVRASSHPPAGSRTTCRRASHPEVSRSGRLAFPRRRARFLAPNSGSRAQPGSTSPDLASTRRRVRVRSCSHLLLCRLIYEANRRPRLATLPENRPRRNLIAPVCVLRV